MIALLATTVLTSAADSLNPVAITQQFVLQGMVKKPKHIWFFILATGITNWIGGMAVYYGLGTVITRGIDFLLIRFGASLFILELVLGMTALLLAGYAVWKNKSKRGMPSKNAADVELKKKQQASLKIKSVAPASLFLLGVLATITELTTAVPYFAFLAVLLNYNLHFFSVAMILLLYNLIYALPLMLLYVIYRKKQALFERFYLWTKRRMTQWSGVLLPLMFLLIGVAMLYHSMTALLK